MPMTRMESFLENLGDGNAKKRLEKLKADLGYETIIILSDYRLIKIRISKFKTKYEIFAIRTSWRKILV